MTCATSFLSEFHPRLVGLTGSADAVKQAAKAYRVYYMKTEEEGDDYLVDHSIIQYVLLPPADLCLPGLTSSLQIGRTKNLCL